MTNPQLKLAVDDFEVEYEIMPLGVGDRRAEILENIERLDDQLEVNMQKIEELNTEIDRLTNHADGLDYTVAVASGVITGLIDSFFGEEIKKFTDKFINKKVVDGAKNQKIKESLRKAEEQAKAKGQKLSDEAKQSIKDKITRDFTAKSENGVVSSEEEKRILSKAIRYLEKNKQSPTDKIWNYPGTKITPETHHLDDFSHHASLIGLAVSILTQFTYYGYFSDSTGSNSKIPIIIDEKNNKLFGTTVPAKIVCGTLNWFWHMVSDVAGTSGKNAGGGMGIPGPLMSLIKTVASLPGINKTKLPEIANSMFKDLKFDFRTEVAQSIPVLMNELFVRVFYSIRRFVNEYKEHHNLRDLNWKKIMPFGNRTVTRMITIATGTFTAVDMADAAIRSVIESGGLNPETLRKFVLKVNFVGVGRFAVAIVTDAKMGIPRSKKRAELSEALSEYFALTNTKIYYRKADVMCSFAEMYDKESELHSAEKDLWIEARNTALAMEQLYEQIGKTCIVYKETVAEMDKCLDDISALMPGIDEKNPGLREKLLARL